MSARAGTRNPRNGRTQEYNRPIQPAIESQREIQCQRQTNGVQHPRPIERRPETDDQERERDDARERWRSLAPSDAVQP